MNLIDCQVEMRKSFIGGFAGQLISGLIWLAAAAASVWLRPGVGMAVLFFGSMLIFPLTQGALRMMGRPARVSAGNRLWGLGAQTAFTVPINFLLVGAATLYKEEWFFPAAMIVVGAHYLPFVTLYGMRIFGVLAAILVCSGAFLGLYGPPIFSAGGWLTAGVLLIFAFILRRLVLEEEKALNEG